MTEVKSSLEGTLQQIYLVICWKRIMMEEIKSDAEWGQKEGLGSLTDSRAMMHHTSAIRQFGQRGNKRGKTPRKRLGQLIWPVDVEETTAVAEGNTFVERSGRSSRQVEGRGEQIGGFKMGEMKNVKWIKGEKSKWVNDRKGKWYIRRSWKDYQLGLVRENWDWKGKPHKNERGAWEIETMNIFLVIIGRKISCEGIEKKRYEARELGGWHAEVDRVNRRMKTTSTVRWGTGKHANNTWYTLSLSTASVHIGVTHRHLHIGVTHRAIYTSASRKISWRTSI